MPRGRPVTDCDKIKNMKVTQRKSSEKAVKATLKKCDDRKTHKIKPCDIVAKKCVSKVVVTKGACNDVKPGKVVDFKNNRSNMLKDMRKRCDEQGVKLNKTCMLSASKPVKCRDVKAIQAKKQKANKVVVAYH
jgi:hypothetical protein